MISYYHTIAHAALISTEGKGNFDELISTGMFVKAKKLFYSLWVSSL